eukprot:2693641-Rhodomonas_salina.4
MEGVGRYDHTLCLYCTSRSHNTLCEYRTWRMGGLGRYQHTLCEYRTWRMESVGRYQGIGGRPWRVCSSCRNTSAGLNATCPNQCLLAAESMPFGDRINAF